MLAKVLWWLGLPLRLFIAAVMLLGCLVMPNSPAEIWADVVKLVRGQI